MNEPDPRQVLARRLRALRAGHWPGKKVNQAQLAAALGGSVPLISSWESRKKPQAPPESRIRDIARFFASPRSFDGQAGRLLGSDELTPAEQEAERELLEELSLLRTAAVDVRGTASRPPVAPDDIPEIASPFGESPYRFNAGERVTIVCGRLPNHMLRNMPYNDPQDPDYIESYRYSDLDALIEVFGHVRAANPASPVGFLDADRPSADVYTGHLVSLGGVDWNVATSSALERLQLPVLQVNDWKTEGGAYFEVTEDDGRKVAHHPRLEESGGRKILREDVALFARAVSPFNRKRFLIICNGMYGRGVYGVVRALTDERFRDRNTEYIQARFRDAEAFCILTRVTVENTVTLTPDWTLPETRLFEWSK